MNSTTEIIVRKSSDRGSADFGWLKSHHSFSFADYYDADFMGYRTLRVINEDYIAAGKGFPAHPHRDMEIFSYVLEGQLEHKDSMGNGRVLEPGQVQLMSAGTGVQHSEFNPGDTDTHMLQIWIKPQKAGLTPRYTEWKPAPNQESEPNVLIISADGRDGSAVIHQDADVYRVKLSAGDSIDHELADGRGLWLQVMRGSLKLNGTGLDAGDAGRADHAGSYTIKAVQDAEALLFDLM